MGDDDDEPFFTPRGKVLSVTPRSELTSPATP